MKGMNRREWWFKVVALIGGAIGIKQSPILKKGDWVKCRAVANGVANPPTISISYIDHANRVIHLNTQLAGDTLIKKGDILTIKGETMTEAYQRRELERGEG